MGGRRYPSNFSLPIDGVAEDYATDQKGRMLGGVVAKGLYTLLNAQSALVAVNDDSKAVYDIAGGTYSWTVEATTWGGATATLYRRKLTGVWTPVVLDGGGNAALTADGHIELAVTEGTALKVVVTGTAPTNMFSNLAGF